MGKILINAETEQGVAEAIIRSVVDFRRDPWPIVSDNAKDLVRKMLNPDPKRRLTAQEVLGEIQPFLYDILDSYHYEKIFMAFNHGISACVWLLLHINLISFNKNIPPLSPDQSSNSIVYG